MSKQKFTLEEVKAVPKAQLRKIINDLKERVKNHDVVKRMFKEYDVDLSEIDFIPMAFAELPVSARTDHAIIYLNYKLLQDGDISKNDHYLVHELVHYLQQTTGTKPTQGASDGDYLLNPYEQEGFQNQTEYLSDTRGDDVAEAYVEKVLDHHDIDNKKEREERKEDLLNLARFSLIDEFEKYAAKIKSNDRMPLRNKKNVDEMMDLIQGWKSKHKEKALKFAEELGPKNLFELLHAMRRWYSGQTMARLIKSYRKDLMKVMDLEPKDVIGVYRGFKVPEDNPIAKHEVGDEFNLKVLRNHGFSSWSIDKSETNKFSGKSKDKVGLIVQLIDEKNVVPILAPQNKTESWFNALYELVIGKSYRPTESEYLIYGSPLKVKVIAVKK